MSLAQFKRLLQDVGKHMGIPDLDCDENGYCGIIPEDGVLIHIQSVPTASIVAIYTEVVTLPEKKVEPLSPFLLQWNMNDALTGDSALGLYENTVIWFMRIETPSLTAHRFQEKLETVVQQVGNLQKEIERITDEINESQSEKETMGNDILPGYALRV